jgi:hypothetical protein
VRALTAIIGLTIAAASTTASASESNSLDPLFRMILHLQAGESKSARSLVDNYPEARPVLVRASNGILGEMLGGAKTSFDEFLVFPTKSCSLIKLTPQSDNVENQNAYDVFFDCHGEGRVMQVTVNERLVTVTDFAHVIVPVEPTPPGNANG